MAVFDRDIQHGFHRQRGQLGIVVFLRRSDNVRLESMAVARQSCGRARQLHRRSQHETLADAGDQCFAREPGFVARAALPVARRQQTAQFTADVDAGRRTETELGEELMQAVYAHGQRQIVKIHVTGFGNRAVQIDGTVPGAFPVAVLAILARQLVEAGAVGMGLGAGNTLFEPPQADKWLDGRSGRILAAQRPVEQRALGVGVQRVVGLRVDTVDEQVRVVGGFADERQYIAVIRVDNHRSAGVVSEGLLGDVLQFGVQRQVKVLAGHRRGAHQGAQYPALGVGFHLAEADFTVQHILVGSFDANLANVSGAAVV